MSNINGSFSVELPVRSVHARTFKQETVSGHGAYSTHARTRHRYALEEKLVAGVGAVPVGTGNGTLSSNASFFSAETLINPLASFGGLGEVEAELTAEELEEQATEAGLDINGTTVIFTNITEPDGMDPTLQDWTIASTLGISQQVIVNQPVSVVGKSVAKALFSAIIKVFVKRKL